LPCAGELAGTITGHQQAVSVGQDRGMLAGAIQPGAYHASTMMFPNFNSSQLSPFQQPLFAARIIQVRSIQAIQVPRAVPTMVLVYHH